MRANRTYHLIVSRDHRGPAFLADQSRRDRIEVVSIEDGEVVLFWTLPAKPAARMLRQLKTDLAGLDAEAFFDKWSAVTLDP